MAELRGCRVVALIALLFFEQTQNQKILSDTKQCGDPQCESLILRAQAIHDYQGPDCRYLSFKTGDEINVYYKLSGKRADLWQGSKGKSYGFFPKDTVSIEEVYLTKEIEVPAQEIDFICLNGGEYVFENEDSVLYKPDETEYSDMDLAMTGDDTFKHQDQNINGNTQIDADLQESQVDLLGKTVPVTSTWAVSDIAGWFGIGKREEIEVVESNKDVKNEDTFRSRKIAISEDMALKESDDVQPENSGWFGGQFTKFLPFGQKQTEAENDNDMLIPSNEGGINDGEKLVDTEKDRSVTIDADPEIKTAEIEKLIHEKEGEVKDAGNSQSKWFNFGITNILGFGNGNEIKEQETAITDSPVISIPSEDVPSNQNTQTETSKVDEIKDNTDSTQHIHPEDVIVKNAPGKDSAVDESSKFDFEKPATAEHYTVKENLDLSLKHTNYLASSLLSFWEEIQLWEIPLLWETASANMLAIYSSFKSIDLSPMKTMIYKAVSSLPEDLQPGPDFFGYSWDVVIFTTLFGFFTIFAFTCRTIRSIKSRSYAKRESKLGVKFAELLDSKSEVLEKLSVVQKEYDDLQLSLQDSSPHKLLSEITEQKALQETLQDSNISFDENLRKLEQELEDEKKRSAKMDAELAEVYEKIKSLEEDLKKGRSQKEEIHTTKKVFEINKVRLETSFQDTVEEKSLLQESIKQLAKEEEGWEERFSELSENSKILSSSMDVMQEDMANKQVQVKSLIDSLLKMKDWSSDVDEDDETEENSVPNIKWDFENGEPLADPQKRTIKKLIYAAMLNASLRTVESEKRQLSENLTDEMKAKEQLLECIKNLQNTMQSLSSEKGNLGIDVEKLKQKISVMSEMYQENETKLHRKLTVQEKERMQKEQKLSKVDEKITFATEELFTSRTRAKELEEELERTARSYQSQVTSYEKKAHDNWLIARAAERELSDYKKETAHIRQRLTESEYKLDLIQKDPFALDVMHAISRDNSPFGPSPVGRLQEGRAFLSPPTLMEGPLRLSPMLPGADRGMRPPGYYPVYAGVKERGDVNADRKSDHQRTLSDSGSLSPPWEREQKNSMPPPGLSYQEPPFPIRRPERFYHYPPPSGRFSGPAELTRNQGKPFMDAPDGRTSPEYRGTNTNRNGSEENDALPSHLPPKEGETIDGPPLGYGVHPPPAMRIPLLPVDPRGPFFRRPFPPPPPHPMEMYGPRDYPGMAPMPMRHPNPQLYPPFPMHGDPYFPPPHLRPPPPRSDHPTEPAPPPNSETQDQQPEPHT
ncbi:melanoma inhibitory activity protein 2 isoform 2-T2 [Discoglossus pictus]